MCGLTQKGFLFPFCSPLRGISSLCRLWDVPMYEWAGAPTSVDSMGPSLPGGRPLSRPVLHVFWLDLLNTLFNSGR